VSAALIALDGLTDLQHGDRQRPRLVDVGQAL
jgi:hypothetical protein